MRAVPTSGRSHSTGSERRPLVSESDLRQVMAQFAAGVTVVTTMRDTVAHALTATAFASVSLSPPLVLVCVSKTSRFHAAVTSTQTWAVSVLAAEQETLARHFSRAGRDLLTQFDGVEVRPAPLSGAPMLEGALAWLECSTYASYDGGDHTILVGQVHFSAVAVPGRPLTYHRGTYGSLG